ncbi:MAG: aminotransferase class I/II-fold pyridoxal phosphate-dependent enzyme, partial [Bacteroidota bacterium]
LQHAIADFLTEPQEYLGLNAFYQQKRDYFLQAIEGSRFRPIACEGTYFQLLDYSAISDERDTNFAKRMTTEYGVAVIPVSVFYSSGRDEKVVRVCFAKTEEVLQQAGEVIVEI